MEIERLKSIKRIDDERELRKAKNRKGKPLIRLPKNYIIN